MRGEETKIFKKWGKVGQGAYDLKKGGTGTPLWTMNLAKKETWLHNFW